MSITPVKRKTRSLYGSKHGLRWRLFVGDCGHSLCLGTLLPGAKLTEHQGPVLAIQID